MSVRPRHDPDQLDLRILAQLQANGRISNAYLSKEIGLSPGPTLRRTRRLEEKGYIRGYRANLSHEKLGFGALAFVQIKLRSQSDCDIRNFEEATSKIPNIRECYLLQGEADFLLKCVARDIYALRALVADTLNLPNIEKVTCTLVIAETCIRPAIPI